MCVLFITGQLWSTVWLSWRLCVFVTREPVSSGQLIHKLAISNHIMPSVIMLPTLEGISLGLTPFRISISVFFHSVISVELFWHWEECKIYYWRNFFKYCCKCWKIHVRSRVGSNTFYSTNKKTVSQILEKDSPRNCDTYYTVTPRSKKIRYVEGRNLKIAAQW